MNSTKGKKKLDTEGISEKIDNVLEKVLGVFVVALLGLLFTGMAPLIDAWRFRASSYEALVQKINDQNVEIRKLQEDISDLNTALGVEKTIKVNLPPSIKVETELKIGE